MPSEADEGRGRDVTHHPEPRNLTSVNFALDLEKTFTYSALGLIVIIFSRNVGGNAIASAGCESPASYLGGGVVFPWIPLQKKSEDDRYAALRRTGLLTTVPVLLAASPVIGFYMGRFLDRWLGTGQAFSIVFLLLGFVAGAVQVAKVVKLANRDPRKKD